MLVAAMKDIEAFYGLKMISWQGDPCVPELLKWEDLKCSYTNKSTPPRIISLYDHYISHKHIET